MVVLVRLKYFKSAVCQHTTVLHSSVFSSVELHSDSLTLRSKFTVQNYECQKTAWNERHCLDRLSSLTSDHYQHQSLVTLPEVDLCTLLSVVKNTSANGQKRTSQERSKNSSSAGSGPEVQKEMTLKGKSSDFK